MLNAGGGITNPHLREVEWMSALISQPAFLVLQGKIGVRYQDGRRDFRMSGTVPTLLVEDSEMLCDDRASKSM